MYASPFVGCQFAPALPWQLARTNGLVVVLRHICRPWLVGSHCETWGYREISGSITRHPTCSERSSSSKDTPNEDLLHLLRIPSGPPRGGRNLYPVLARAWSVPVMRYVSWGPIPFV